MKIKNSTHANVIANFNKYYLHLLLNVRHNCCDETSNSKFNKRDTKRIHIQSRFFIHLLWWGSWKQSARVARSLCVSLYQHPSTFIYLIFSLLLQFKEMWTPAYWAPWPSFIHIIQVTPFSMFACMISATFREIGSRRNYVNVSGYRWTKIPFTLIRDFLLLR